MATQYRMTPEMQQRYGVPEWVTFDGEQLSLNEAISLEEEVGWTIDEFVAQVDVPVLNADGTPKLSAKGEPLARTSPKATKFIVWCAVRRSGATVGFDEFDAPLFGLERRSDAQPDPKDEATEDPSTPESSSDDSETPSATS